VNRTAWGLDSGRDVDWLTKAECRKHPPEWWSVPDGSTVKLTADNRRAMVVCASCPVAGECERETDPALHAGTIRAGRVVRRDEWARCVKCRQPFERSRRGRGTTWPGRRPASRARPPGRSISSSTGSSGGRAEDRMRTQPVDTSVEGAGEAWWVPGW
jgi:hypothetical protein